jgi:epoxyqueuosine reductase
LLGDASPLVRGAAVWALSRLLPREELQKLRREDGDASVNDEWALALSN